MLRVNPGGSKSWYVQLDRNHKRKIGDASVLTTAMARHRARDLLMRGERLKQRSRGERGESLGEFLSGRYATWMGRNSRFGARDTRHLVNALGELASKPIDEVGVSHIERWKLQRAARVRPATVQRELNALRAALNRAQSWRLVSENPARRVRYRPEKTAGRLRVLSDAERARLLERLGRRGDTLAILAITALNTGLGRSELFRLRWKDIHFGARCTVEVCAGRKQRHRSRRVPLNDLAADALRSWSRNRLQRGTLVFPGAKGGPLTNISAAWSELMRESQIRGFRLSDCRHDFAARLAGAGVPLDRIRDLLGLSTLNHVERYAAFASGTLETAVDRLA